MDKVLSDIFKKLSLKIKSLSSVIDGAVLNVCFVLIVKTFVNACYRLKSENFQTQQLLYILSFV